MDDALRTSLWNVVIQYLPRTSHFGDGTTRRVRWSAWQRVWSDGLKCPLDDSPSADREWLKVMRDMFFRWRWNEVYDLLEYLTQSLSPEEGRDKFASHCNSVMEREMSAYRIIQGEVTPISDETEVSTIETAAADGGGHEEVQAHLQRTLELLSDRTNPDYRNSVKESISAVEGMCAKVAGQSKADIRSALRKLNLHAALSGAFEKLYAYTSDASGIRHALMEEENLDFADAKFMLVACSAFVNYLRSKAP